MNSNFHIGIDLVQVRRIERLVNRWEEKFLDRVYTPTEQHYCLNRARKYEHLAGRFAAKEAIIKAFGTRVPWSSLEIVATPSGAPSVKIKQDLDALEERSLSEIGVSISHTQDYAIANAWIINRE